MSALRTLQFHQHPAREEYRLPYAGSPTTTRNGNIVFWSVPLTGGYSGGVHTGDALAVLALRYLRQHPEETKDENHLVSTVLGWLEATKSANSEEFETLKGQVVGFIGRITPWATAAARHVGQNLDTHDPEKILEQANNGLEWVKPAKPWQQSNMHPDA